MHSAILQQVDLLEDKEFPDYGIAVNASQGALRRQCETVFASAIENGFLKAFPAETTRFFHEPYGIEACIVTFQSEQRNALFSRANPDDVRGEAHPLSYDLSICVQPLKGPELIHQFCLRPDATGGAELRIPHNGLVYSLGDATSRQLEEVSDLIVNKDALLLPWLEEVQ